MIGNLLTIFLCSIPFGVFLFRSIDLWHGQGHFIQMGILILFCASLCQAPKKTTIFNLPLASFTLWAGLVTGFLWVKVLSQSQQYAVKIFLPFFNWLCVIIFYKLCIEYLDSKKITRILNYLKYAAIVYLFYCVIQYLKLDQFLQGLSLKDELVGTLGNPSHLAGFLAIIQPLFFSKKNVLALILLWIVIVLTGSASGAFVGVAVIIFWLIAKRKFLFCSIFWVITLILGTAVFLNNPNFFNSSHRVEIWIKAFDVMKNKFISGYGLGSFGMMKFQLEGIASTWRHLHNEFYQLNFELGIVGLCLILWCIWEYFRTFRTLKTDLTVKIASIFFGFCILSMFSFCAHLWQIAIYGAMGYSFLYVIKNEVLNGD